jgi:hypothetical protein
MTGSKVINLNKARKARAKDKARVSADENAVRFGMNRARREAEEATRDKAARTLDAHRRDTGGDNTDTDAIPT